MRWRSRVAILLLAGIEAALVCGCATPAAYSKWNNRLASTSSIALKAEQALSSSVRVAWRIPASEEPLADGIVSFDPDLDSCARIEVFATRDGEALSPDLTGWHALPTDRLADTVSPLDVWTRIESRHCTVLLLIERTTEPGRLTLHASTVTRSVGSWQIPSHKHEWLPVLPFAAAVDVFGVAPLLCIADPKCPFAILDVLDDFVLARRR